MLSEYHWVPPLVALSHCLYKKKEYDEVLHSIFVIILPNNLGVNS